MVTSKAGGEGAQRRKDPTWEAPFTEQRFSQNSLAQHPGGHRYPAPLHLVSSSKEAEKDNSTHSPDCGAA